MKFISKLGSLFQSKPAARPPVLEDESLYVYLQAGDVFEHGDEYGMPHFKFIVRGNGLGGTNLMPGDVVPAEIMCYRPRRFIKSWLGHTQESLTRQITDARERGQSRQPGN